MSIHTVIYSVVSSSPYSSSTLCFEYKHRVTFERIACLTRILEVTGSNPFTKPSSLTDLSTIVLSPSRQMSGETQHQATEYSLHTKPNSLTDLSTIVLSPSLQMSGETQHQATEYSLRVIYNSTFISHPNNKIEFEVKLCLQSWRLKLCVSPNLLSPPTRIDGVIYQKTTT